MAADRPATDRVAWGTTVVCMLGLIITLHGSSLGAYLFLAAWGLVALARAEACLRLLFRAPGFWLFPLFALVSVAWSQAPGPTLRAAVELLLTVGVAALTAGFLRPREFLTAMLVSLLVGAMLSLAFGQYGTDGMTGETVFLGIFASKNTMALFLSFLAIFAAAVLADRQQPPFWRLLGLFSFLLSIPLLIRAHSAGAIVTTAATFGTFVLMLALARLHARERVLILAGAAAVLLPVLIVVLLLALNGTLMEAVSGFITGVLGKDTTLTGRTLLWQIALDEIRKRPFLGVGYSAFWLQGNLVVEAIWRYFQIEGRSGFEFHDTYLQIGVELGWIGVAVLALTLAQALIRSIRLALAAPNLATAALFAAMFCMATRSVVEVDAFYPFSIGTFLLYVIAAYGAEYVALLRRLPRPVPGPRVTWRMRAATQPQAGA